jgi:hypothetical protein
MGKIAGRKARVILEGRDMSCTSNNATLTFSAEAPEVTTFCDDNRARMQDGIKDVELSVDGFYDTGASGADVALSHMLAASVLTGFYPTGYGTCQVAYEMGGILTNYEMTFALEDAGTMSLTVSGSPPLLRGYQLYQGTIAAAGASNMNGVNYTNGNLGTRTAAVHLLSLTGTAPEFSASIQESPDDSAWTTVATVMSVSPAGAGSPMGASLITISSACKYQRVAASLTGTTPCATFLVSMGNSI